jgi:bifunctional pyridoxal-dependent enzyme with beta-cystathionase and maltose regulon repressor activities
VEAWLDSAISLLEERIKNTQKEKVSLVEFMDLQKTYLKDLSRREVKSEEVLKELIARKALDKSGS